jgi:DNA-binding transcriptional LysR family regulator
MAAYTFPGTGPAAQSWPEPSRSPRNSPHVQEFPAFDRSAFALRSDSGLAQLAAIRDGFGIDMCPLPTARPDPRLIRILANQHPGCGS